MNTIKIDKNGTDVKMIAHRGLSGLEQENTCAAFVAAGNRETYFGIETDIHCTADGEFIIIHDDSTERVAGQNLIVEQTDFQTLRNLPVFDHGSDLPRGDLQLPTLQEYISICKRYEKTAVLELKNPIPENHICNIMRIVTGLEYADHMIVISFYPDNLIALRKHYPDQTAQFLTEQWEDDWFSTLKQNNLGLDIYHKSVTKELVEKFHEAGLEVNCWTVDDPKDAARVISCGVDYITTNILE